MASFGRIVMMILLLGLICVLGILLLFTVHHLIFGNHVNSIAHRVDLVGERLVPLAMFLFIGLESLMVHKAVKLNKYDVRLIQLFFGMLAFQGVWIGLTLAVNRIWGKQGAASSMYYRSYGRPLHYTSTRYNYNSGYQKPAAGPAPYGISCSSNHELAIFGAHPFIPCGLDDPTQSHVIAGVVAGFYMILFLLAARLDVKDADHRHPHHKSMGPRMALFLQILVFAAWLCDVVLSFEGSGDDMYLGYTGDVAQELGLGVMVMYGISLQRKAWLAHTRILHNVFVVLALIGAFKLAMAILEQKSWSATAPIRFVLLTTHCGGYIFLLFLYQLHAVCQAPSEMHLPPFEESHSDTDAPRNSIYTNIANPELRYNSQQDPRHSVQQDQRFSVQQDRHSVQQNVYAPPYMTALVTPTAPSMEV